MLVRIIFSNHVISRGIIESLLLDATFFFIFRQLRQRVSRAAEGTRVRRATREESQRDKEERMNKIAAANEDNDLRFEYFISLYFLIFFCRESLCLTYSRKCPVCLRKHPEKRVSYLCGHIVCEPCAESQEMQSVNIS